MGKNTRIIPVWRDRISIFGQLAEQAGVSVQRFGEDFIKTNSSIANSNVFFKFIGKSQADFKQYIDFLKTESNTVPENLKSVAKAFNVWGEDIGETWAQVGAGLSKPFSKFNISSIQNSPMLKIIDGVDKQVKESEKELNLIYTRYVDALASGKDTSTIEKEIKRQEDVLGNYKRAYGEALEMYNQKSELVKLFNENPLLLSDEGIKYLTRTNIVSGSDETVLQNLKVFLKGTTSEIIDMIKSTADEMNKEIAESFKPENIAKSFAGYEEATKMIATDVIIYIVLVVRAALNNK